MSGDNSMYYSSYNRKRGVVFDGDEGDYFTKIYSSSRSGETWSKGEELPKHINRSDFHASNPKISSDGEWMFFTRTLLQGEKIDVSEVYISKKKDDGWAPPRKIKGLSGGAPIQHPMPGELYGDEVLFFVTTIDGGFGGSDIYYAKRKGEYEYDTPINIGRYH